MIKFEEIYPVFVPSFDEKNNMLHKDEHHIMSGSPLRSEDSFSIKVLRERLEYLEEVKTELDKIKGYSFSPSLWDSAISDEIRVIEEFIEEMKIDYPEYIDELEFIDKEHSGKYLRMEYSSNSKVDIYKFPYCYIDWDRAVNELLRECVYEQVYAGNIAIIIVKGGGIG